LSATRDLGDVRSTVTFRAYAGTKLMLLGDRGTWTTWPELHMTVQCTGFQLEGLTP